MATQIDLPNGNVLKFEPQGQIKIHTEGANAADFQSITFRGIRRNLINENGEAIDTEIVNASGSMSSQGVGEILTPSEMLTLADLLGKVADATEGFKQAKANDIVRLKAMGVELP